MEFANKLKIIRQKFGLSQHEFANLFHLSRKTISAWENNRAKPDKATLNAISKMFNINKDVLLNRHLSPKTFSFWINQKVRSITIIISAIQTILIILQYLTLFNMLNIVYNSILLIILTISIGYLVHPFHYLKSKKLILFVLLTTNIFLGFLTLIEKTDRLNITVSFFYGSILGKIMIVLLLTYSSYVLLCFLRIIKIIKGGVVND